MRILPDPRRPYLLLKADLLRLGWVWASEPQTLPLLPGEPELVEYRHRSGGKLRYSFNPAIGLREIDVDAADEELARLAGLPRLDGAGVVALLEEVAVESILRGLFAARSLRLMAVLDRVHRLCRHPDELVRQTAADVARSLPVAAVEDAWTRFQTLRAERPGRSMLLELMPVADRLQILRWMGKDSRGANAEILAALRSGLMDEHAEVRATAALVAARLRARELTETIREAMPAPALAAAHERALDALVAESPLALPEPEDDAALLLHALIEPLPVIPPPALPRHLRRQGASVRLVRSGLEVALVPSMPHWLGTSADRASSLRRSAERPFAIGVSPLDHRAAKVLGLSSFAEGPVVLSPEDAIAWVRRLGELEGIPMALPTVEQWEMAMRGPDGRCFAAGNLRAEATVSPWGVAALDEPEWLTDRTMRTGSDPVRTQGDQRARCAARFVMAFPS
jgi:hypothetical protein